MFIDPQYDMEKRLAKERSLLDSAIQITEDTPTPRTTDHWVRWTLEIPSPSPPLTLVLTFPKNYPFVSPLVQIRNHPLLDRLTFCHSPEGHLCMSDFLPEWSAALTTTYIVQKITRLLAKS